MQYGCPAVRLVREGEVAVKTRGRRAWTGA